MSDARVPNPLLLQFRRGGIPRELRLLAAQGALPLKPEDLVELLHDLSQDEDSDVAASAHATLAAMPAGELLPIFKDRQTPPPILGWGLANRLESELREAVLQNPGTPDEAIEAEVGELPEDLAELVVINQVRLLRRTSLLEALETNAHLNRDQQRRLRELRESFHIGAEAAPQPPPAAPPAAAPPPAAAEPEQPAEPVLMESDITDEVDAMFRYLTEEERREAERVSTVQRLYRLNTAEKLVTALKGTREERAVLVRDPNRLVAAAVLGSPRVTDPEIESFAGMRNVSAEVLRQIGNNREWTKRYGVVSSLVKNPRTPLAVSLGMVSRLNPRDLRALTLDRNVPEVLRRQAQKFAQTVSGTRPGSGKH